MNIKNAFLITCFLTFSASTCSAEFLYDGMTYPAGSQLVQQNGGTGFNGSWYSSGFSISRSDFAIDSTTLSYENLDVSGGAVSAPSGETLNGVARGMPRSFVSGVHYLSFLIERNSTDGAFGGFGGLYLDGGTEDIFVGKPGANNLWSVETRGGTGLVSSNYTANVNQTTLLVLKIEMPGAVGSADVFSLYVNPVLGNPEPLVPDATKRSSDIGPLNSIVLYNSGNYTFDEIRMGDTFASVTPTITAVPEPTSLALLGVVIAVWGMYFVSRKASVPMPETP